MKMRRVHGQELAAILLTIVLAGWAGVLPAAASIRVEPSRFIFSLGPGERTTGAITVLNNTDREIDLFANVYDWDHDDQHDMRTYEAGTLDETLEGLLRFNPRRFSLGPGEGQLVRFTVGLPEEDAERERRGIIFFEHEEVFEAEEGMGATVRSMIGTTIYALPASPALRFQLLQGLVHVTEDGDYVGALLTKNESGVHIRVSLDYRVVDGRGRMVEEGSVSERVLLPGGVRPIFFPLEGGYQPGEYELLITFDVPGIREDMTTAIDFQVGSQ